MQFGLREESLALPGHVDGRLRFDPATQMYEARKMGNNIKPTSLGDTVMVESVKAARTRKGLKSKGTLNILRRLYYLGGWSRRNNSLPDTETGRVSRLRRLLIQEELLEPR